MKTIAVDYDGTIVDFAFPLSGAPKPHVQGALQLFKALGYKVTIFSCRTCGHFESPVGTPYEREVIIKDMVDTLEKYGIPYDEIDDGTKGKPPAEFYIDDKGIRFDDNWPQIALFILSNT